jgi:hypothetical protein
MINFNDITSCQINGSGVFDKLMYVSKLHIIEEQEAGRITGSEYANVYLTLMQNIISQSIEYVTKKELIEAQILGAQKDTDLKSAQILGIEKDNLVKDEQIQMSIYERTFIQPKQLEKITQEIEVSNAQESEIIRNTARQDEELIDKLLTTSKQRLSIDKEIEVQTEQKKDLYASRVLKDKQSAILGLDNVVKNLNLAPEAIYKPKYEETV